MIIQQRPFTGPADLPAMLALARQFPGEALHVIDLPYRFSSWALDDPGNVALWFDESNQLQAWAALQAPFWMLDYTQNPGHAAHLFPAILDWADQRARQLRHTPFERPAWYANVFAGQVELIRCLEQAGFACQADLGEDSWSKVLMERPAGLPLTAYPPRPGFTVRPLSGLAAGPADVPAYVELHRTVFGTKNMTVEWRLRTLQQPDYNPELDLLVVDAGGQADGRPVAFCIAWLQPELRIGQIEPLGCHPDYRKFALGRVALAEALHRLEAHGARTILVETDSFRNTAFRLYESLGFQVIQDVLVYRKDYV
jgi:ribosomal protein S18 acetylase RimI-like enzyme